MTSVEPIRSTTVKRHTRLTLLVVMLIMVFTGRLVAVKYWVVSHYLLPDR
jgi:hypothetical protein